jgi:GSH-dependent disulfide-bond oxidoreductase
MIDLYAANTPNGQRAVVVVEEMALPYRLHKLDLSKGETKTPEFLKLNPNARAPVIVDPQGFGGRPVTVAQSWAISLYLAEKTGQFIPSDPRGRLTVIEWLFHLASDVMMVHSTLNAVSNFVPEKTRSTIEFYEARVLDAFRNLDRRLGETPYIAGDLSIADLDFYPVYNYRRSFIDRYPELNNLRRWGKSMDERPACRRGVDALR